MIIYSGIVIIICHPPVSLQNPWASNDNNAVKMNIVYNNQIHILMLQKRTTLIKLLHNKGLSIFIRIIPGFYILNFRSIVTKKPGISNVHHCVCVSSP